MGYYMRFFDTSEEPLTINGIETAIKEQDQAYRLESPDSAKRPHADLYLGEDIYAEIEINHPGDGLFDDEIEEMLEFLKDTKGKNCKRVESVLKNAKRIVSVRVLWQGRESDATLAAIDPLWIWLFSNRKGLLQADGEGYYAGKELILEDR